MALLLETGRLAESISSLEELVHALDRESRPAGYTDALLRFRASPEEMAARARWNTRQYTRQCIHRTRNHELLLICYEPGQRTSIHDYDSQMAWIKPVEGAVNEERFILGGKGQLIRASTKVLGTGMLSYMAHGNRIHRHSNAVQGRSITLNLYARPLLRWRVYDEHAGGASVLRAAPANEG